MLAASKVKMSGSEKESENIESFKLKSWNNNGKEMCKKVFSRAKLFFCYLHLLLLLLLLLLFLFAVLNAVAV